MSEMVPRREALRLAVLAAATSSALALATPAGTAQAAARMVAPLPQNDPPVPGSWIVKPFANSQVTLGTSLFTANRDRILTFLRSYSADRMLANFRANAGLDTLGAQPPGGWDDATGSLRGLLLPLVRIYDVPLDDLVGAPRLGDPRIHLKPIRRFDDLRSVVPAAGRYAGVQDDHPRSAETARTDPADSRRLRMAVRAQRPPAAGARGARPDIDAR
ncbi:hypothetical protein GCM10020216_015110 [Nonomuraea helvata]